MHIQLEESQLVLLDSALHNIGSSEQGQNALKAMSQLAQIARLLKVPVWGGVHMCKADSQSEMPNNQARPILVRDLCHTVVSGQAFDACAYGLKELLIAPAGESMHARQQGQHAKGAAKSMPIKGNARSLPKHLQKPAHLDEESSARATILLGGFETHLGVLQTALSLVEAEFDVCLVTDACLSSQVHNHEAALDRLAGAGVELVTAEMVVFEWLGSAQHPCFEQSIKILGRSI